MKIFFIINHWQFDFFGCCHKKIAHFKCDQNWPKNNHLALSPRLNPELSDTHEIPLAKQGGLPKHFISDIQKKPNGNPENSHNIFCEIEIERTVVKSLHGVKRDNRFVTTSKAILTNGTFSMEINLGKVLLRNFNNLTNA